MRCRRRLRAIFFSDGDHLNHGTPDAPKKRTTSKTLPGFVNDSRKICSYVAELRSEASPTEGAFFTVPPPFTQSCDASRPPAPKAHWQVASRYPVAAAAF